jgi:CHAP domain
MQIIKKKLPRLSSISSQLLSKLPAWMTLSVLSQVAVAPLLILEAGSMGKAEAISQNQPTARSCRDIDMKLNMTTNRTLAKGKFVMNTCGYALRFQADGNLVLTNSSSQVLWATGTERKGSTLVMQSDGNLVLHANHGSKLWETDTSKNPGAFISLQGDGNLVIYQKDRKKVLWSSGTSTGKITTNSAANEWRVAKAKKIADQIAAERKAAEEIAARKAAETPVVRVDTPIVVSGRASQRKINEFVSKFNGTSNIQRHDAWGDPGLQGQCVTLVIRYLQDYYGGSHSGMALGHGRNVAAGAASQLSGSFLPLSDPSDPIPGSIISFQGFDPRYGHVALVTNSSRDGDFLNITILESNGDVRALFGDSVVSTRNIRVNAKNYSSSYGDRAFWVNPRD